VIYIFTALHGYVLCTTIARVSSVYFVGGLGRLEPGWGAFVGVVVLLVRVGEGW